jgi:hypothetical protein
VGKAKSTDWLTQEALYGELGTASKAAYRNYVDQGVDNETELFYQKKRKPSIWGDKRFAESALAKACSWDREVTRKGIVETVSKKEIVSRVASFFDCTEQSICQAQ